jgi:hypothetical protein
MIQSIVTTQSLKYHDDVTSYFQITLLKPSLKKKDKCPLLTSTSCLIIKGNLQFKDNKFKP